MLPTVQIGEYVMRQRSQSRQSQKTTSDREDVEGPFAQGAPILLSMNLAPLPLGGDDGKRPLIRGYQKLTHGRIFANLPHWIERFGVQNIGLVTGTSGLVIVDIDDPNLLDKMLERFGPTPIIVQTPSKAFHLYYKDRYRITPSLNLRPRENLAVDIKAASGVVAVPTSVNLLSGEPYTFFRGNWTCITSLPDFNAASLPNHSENSRAVGARNLKRRGRIGIGQRNDFLFRELLKHAPFCDNCDAILDVAMSFNESVFEEPLPANEVASTARSAWRYEQEDRNWVGRSPRCVLCQEDLIRFAREKNGGDALIFWAHLVGQHAKRHEPIILDREAMAAAGVLPGWTAWRYRTAIETLKQMRLVERVGGGGRRPDKTFAPHQYRLCQPVAESRQNTIPTAAPRRPSANSKSGDRK